MKIYVDIVGGLGNQMFSYAMGYSLSKEKKAQLIIDTTGQDSGRERPFELDAFNIEYSKRLSRKYGSSIFEKLKNRICKKISIGLFTPIYTEKKEMVYDPEVFDIERSTCFHGYWQCEKYFKKYRSELLQQFYPRDSVSADVKKILSDLDGIHTVSIHVRRGDYLQYGCALPMEYYDRAVHMICEQVRNPVFCVFSDDLLYCKDYFQKFKDVPFRFIEYKSSNTTIEDLYIMSQCKHNIIANSSFSWWGAWLNRNPDKIVICPETGIWTGDFYPEEWIKIRL